jgi:hypothetical protein
MIRFTPTQSRDHEGNDQTRARHGSQIMTGAPAALVSLHAQALSYRKCKELGVQRSAMYTKGDDEEQRVGRPPQGNGYKR